MLGDKQLLDEFLFARLSNRQWATRLVQAMMSMVSNTFLEIYQKAEIYRLAKIKKGNYNRINALNVNGIHI